MKEIEYLINEHKEDLFAESLELDPTFLEHLTQTSMPSEIATIEKDVLNAQPAVENSDTYSDVNPDIHSDIHFIQGSKILNSNMIKYLFIFGLGFSSASLILPNIELANPSQEISGNVKPAELQNFSQLTNNQTKSPTKTQIKTIDNKISLTVNKNEEWDLNQSNQTSHATHEAEKYSKNSFAKITPNEKAKGLNKRIELVNNPKKNIAKHSPKKVKENLTRQKVVQDIAVMEPSFEKNSFIQEPLNSENISNNNQTPYLIKLEQNGKGSPQEVSKEYISNAETLNRLKKINILWDKGKRSKALKKLEGLAKENNGSALENDLWIKAFKWHSENEKWQRANEIYEYYILTSPNAHKEHLKEIYVRNQNRK